MNEHEQTMHGAAPGAANEDPREERVRSLYAAAYPPAYPSAEPSEELERRVAELAAQHGAPRARVAAGCGEALEAHSTAARRPAWNRRSWAPLARWAALALAAAAIGLVWMSDRPGAEVLAAAIRATEAAPAWHLVATGDAGPIQEGWFVLGVGSYERRIGPTGRTSMITVDDRRHRYVYTPGKRQAEVWPSDMGDRTSTRILQQHLTGAGILRELKSHAAVQAYQVRKAMLNHHRLWQITLPGLARAYVDPVTDRVVSMETIAGGALSRTGLRRCEIDYPDPARIDPARFRFVIPPGVTVVQRNLALQPDNASDPGSVCSWRLLQLRKAFLAYVGDHHGEWPRALRPDLDAYVQDEGVFYCPLDRRDTRGKSTSYIYHRPAAPADPAALEERWNADNRSSPETSDRLGMLVECRLHTGEKRALYMDGRVLTGYSHPVAAAGK